MPAIVLAIAKPITLRRTPSLKSCCHYGVMHDAMRPALRLRPGVAPALADNVVDPCIKMSTIFRCALLTAPTARITLKNSPER